MTTFSIQFTDKEHEERFLRYCRIWLCIPHVLLGLIIVSVILADPSFGAILPTVMKLLTRKIARYLR